MTSSSSAPGTTASPAPPTLPAPGSGSRPSGGALHLDQLYSLRPVAGHADYRAPIAGLYMCGSGAHPGGGVTGASGHNAAREIARDFKRRRVA